MTKEQGWRRISRFNNNAAYVIGQLEVKMMCHRRSSKALKILTSQDPTSKILIIYRHIFLLFLILRIRRYIKTIPTVKSGPPVCQKKRSCFQEKLDVMTLCS